MPAIVQQKPAVSSWVIFKLLAFTAALITLPIGTYFYTVERLFEGRNRKKEGNVDSVIYKRDAYYKATERTPQDRLLWWRIW